MNTAMMHFWLLVGLMGGLAATIAAVGATPIEKLVPVRVRRNSARRPDRR